MKQRVGFARALAVEPEILFMDEPFSALDVLTAENLRGELMELWLGKKIPTKSIFLVTHNIEEAVLLADRIVVLGRHPAKIRADFRIRQRTQGTSQRRISPLCGLHLQTHHTASRWRLGRRKWAVQRNPPSNDPACPARRDRRTT